MHTSKTQKNEKNKIKFGGGAVRLHRKPQNWVFPATVNSK